MSIIFHPFFFLSLRPPPTSTLFPTRRSSDLGTGAHDPHSEAAHAFTAGETYGSQQRADSGESHQNTESPGATMQDLLGGARDRKSTRLNSSHTVISYAVFCLKKKKKKKHKTN